MLCLSLTAFGQGGQGSIGGKITDPNGQAIAGAKVTATNVDTNSSTETVSTESGDYQIPQLAPGRYQVVVEASNFKRLERTGITCAGVGSLNN
ncbi:MAG: carboxypeptidase-like regulatory domain-containing protein [Pyrinomonadaceae bacterium]